MRGSWRGKALGADYDRDGLRGGRDALGGTEGREVGRKVGRLPGCTRLVGAALRLGGGLRGGLGVWHDGAAVADGAVYRAAKRETRNQDCEKNTG